MSLLGELPGAPKRAGAQGWKELYPLACELFRLGALGEAYRIFASLEGEREHPALLTGIALCHMAAGQYERALNYLDRALTLVKRRPLNDRSPRNETCGILAEREREGRGYLAPMPEGAPEHAPDYARDTVRRLIIDCCAELGLWDRVRTTAEAMKPRRYANVESALERAGR